MARTRDWRRRQRYLHRGKEKYTDWWHAYTRSDGDCYGWPCEKADRAYRKHRGRWFDEAPQP